MKCFQCQKDDAPPNARFCVHCGYALLQACPYGCGHRSLPVRADNPLAKCPSCAKFLTVCLNCQRLLPLGALICPTTRCAIAQTRPVEPFLAHGGFSGGAPLELGRNWSNAAPKPLSPGEEMATTAANFGALSSRYGLVVWWQNASLSLWSGPIRGQNWPAARPQSINFFAPFPSDGLWPLRQGLLLAHGHAYALHPGGVARVSLSETNHNSVQSLVIREADSTGAANSFDGSVDTPEWGILLDFAVEEATAEEATASPQTAPHQVNWMAQAATATFWFAVGQWRGGIVGVQMRGADALFEAQPWVLPSQIAASQWRELLIWNEAPAIRTLDAIWREEGGVWVRKYGVDGSSHSLDGAVADGKGLWIWGRVAGRLWMRRLDDGGENLGLSRLGLSGEVSMPLAPTDQIFPFPIVRGAKFTFFQTGARNFVVTLDLTRPLDDPHRQEILAAVSLIWATSVSHAASGAEWLLYATDDGVIVTLWLMAFAPLPQDPLLLMRFRPLRAAPGQSWGATLAATLSNDALLISYASQSATWIRAFEW